MLAYRLLMTFAAPVLLGRFALRRLSGAETADDLRQRLGHGTGEPRAIWLHGASNGELASARPVVDALLQALPDTPLVVTSHTKTGRGVVERWGLPRVTPRLAPIDTRAALRRFRRAWRPSLLIVMENELWPNRLLTTEAPIAVIGARMSERSFRGWSRAPRLAARLLSELDYVSPQDPQSRRYLTELGLPSDRLGPTGTLKSAIALPDPEPEALAVLAPLFPRARTLLAASTHEGEEEIVLEGFARALRQDPARRLILAPRHPVRGDSVAELIGRAGLSFARRSTGEVPGPDTAVYLADTMGEMPLWYRLAGVTLVCGSLEPIGGHTPFEPAAAGSAVLHGPHTTNFAPPYAALDAEGGAIMVSDAGELAEALQRLATAEAQERQASRATDTLARLGDSAALVEEITGALRGLIGR